MGEEINFIVTEYTLNAHDFKKYYNKRTE